MPCSSVSIVNFAYVIAGWNIISRLIDWLVLNMWTALVGLLDLNIVNNFELSTIQYRKGMFKNVWHM